MIKKELVCFIETNEEGEFIKINALETDPGFFLLTLGTNRMVVNGSELVEAMSSIDYYGTLFRQEAKAKEQRAKAPAKPVTIAPAKKSKARKDGEEEGTIVLEPSLRMGPTESELALERQTRHMQGDTIIITEKDK